MADATQLVRAVKQAALDAQEAAKPVQLCFGRVESVSPLQIAVEQKLTLGEKQLAVPRRLRDHTVRVRLDAATTPAEGHTHSLRGEVDAAVPSPLAPGDTVLLARMQGGQKYVLLDIFR